MNAPAVLVEMEQDALTLSTRTPVAVSPVTREDTASLVSLRIRRVVDCFSVEIVLELATHNTL